MAAFLFYFYTKFNKLNSLSTSTQSTVRNLSNAGSKQKSNFWVYYKRMETPRNPWAPSPARLELEFQRKTLNDINDQIRTFSKENDITYSVEKEHDSLTVQAQEGDFDALRKFVGENLKNLNERLENHGKAFLFVIDDQVGKFIIKKENR